MTPATTSTPAASRRIARRPNPNSRHRSRPRARRPPDGHPESRTLDRYADDVGRLREIVARHGAAGSVLLIDRDARTLGDCRLIAHLAADEPAQNAALVCREYLAEPPDARGRCRRVTAEDLDSVPFGEAADLDPADTGGICDPASLSRNGLAYRLELIDGEMSIPTLRWRAHPVDGREQAPSPVSLREAVAVFESYEPLCAISERALRGHGNDDRVSTVRLATELERVRVSPIVLNRLLRSTVLAAVERQGLSLSEIATRCGRTKRDRKGVQSGETSWLARRIGLLAEGGHDAPTPWIHSDVLALIARRGLGISPREVELH